MESNSVRSCDDDDTRLLRLKLQCKAKTYSALLRMALGMPEFRHKKKKEKPVTLYVDEELYKKLKELNKGAETMGKTIKKILDLFEEKLESPNA